MKTDKQRQNDRKKKHTEKVSHAIRRTVLLGILDKVQWPFDEYSLRFACNSLLSEMHYDDRKRLAELHGWVDELRAKFEAKRKSPKDRFTPDIDGYTRERVSLMDSTKLARFMVAASLVGNLHEPGYSWDGRKMGTYDALMAQAKHSGVDVGAIRAAVTKEMPYAPPKKKKPKAKKKAGEKSTPAKKGRGTIPADAAAPKTKK